MYKLAILFSCIAVFQTAMAQSSNTIHKADAPLYRDPIYDGAADPVIVWNRQEKNWWMLYTQRRANVDGPDVSYCYGSDIGIAASSDNGKTWVYRGALRLEFEKGRNTFWAPDIVYFNNTYHMFVAYIQGVHNHWGGSARMAHYTSANLWDWKLEGFVTLSSEKVIDASLFQMPDKTWRMWYKDETKGSATMVAESKDLKSWKVMEKPAISGTAQEGPKIFFYKDYYWMITDEWHGMRVYRSKDATNWEKQGLVLDGPSARPEDTPSGAHGDVVVVGDKAYIYYFTHPGRKKHSETEMNAEGIYPYSIRRSSIQVAELVLKDGTLTCDRDQPFDYFMPEIK